MSHRINSLFVGAALVVGSSFITATVIGQNQEGDRGMGQEMADDPMMAAWMEYMTPGEPHRAMAAHAGKWNMTAKMWMDPNAPPQVSQNTATMKPIMGGRYMLEHVEGEPGAMMPGVTFKGMNIMGYDNHKKVHTFAWVDNLGTGIFTGEGSANADGTKITYMAEAPDLFNPGQMKPVKSVTEHVSDDKIVFSMYEINESGEWRKNFEGVYTRADANGKTKKRENMKNMNR